MTSSSVTFPFRRLLLGVGAVLLALAGKLALVERYGTDQPYADQWAAEGMYFLRGPLYYDITLEQLGSLHSEHRPGLTRVWVRALILANEGQWDCYVELVANLLIYAGFLGVLWAWIARLLSGASQVALAVALAAFFALPAAYENFLWGFQSGFLFLLLLGAGHLTGTLQDETLGWRWGLAQLIGGLGLFSVAAGCMSAATLVVIAAIRLVQGQHARWAWATLAVNAAIFGLGVALVPEGAQSGDPLFERLTRLGTSLGYLLAWPFPTPWMAILLYAPWLGLLVRAVRRPGELAMTSELRLCALGLWVMGMIAAIAYGRGVTGDTIGVRYFDVLLLGLFANVPALLWFVATQTRWRRGVAGSLGLAWIVCVAGGLWTLNRPERLNPMFDFQQGVANEQREVLRRFLASDDPTELQAFAQRTGRFPHFDTTLTFLRDPKVPALLPPSLTPDGHQNRLSRLARGVSSQWPAFMLLGFAGFIAGAVATWRAAGSRRTELSP